MALDTRPGQELAGYRIEALLGRGGMGVCYRAFDPELQRPVALKLIAPELASDPAFKERFLQEIAVAASLEHPHVCPVYRAGEADGELYVCMRLLQPESLASRIAAEGALEPGRAVSLVAQLASALDLAHARSLLHRDVKPENVLLDEAGNAYLADFGLAGAIWQADEHALFAGTLAYLAPERCRGEPALAASDLYALACLAYVLLTGAPPFAKEHEAALLYAHLREEPPSLAPLGLARLDPVFGQALAKDASERHSSCHAFAEELSHALSRPERGDAESWPEGLPRPATRLVGRRRELAEVAELLHDPATRLLTLTGPGGTGKTRLALQAAAESADAFPDGISWVSLASLRDPAYVLSAIAQALEISEQPPAPLADTVSQALQDKRCLLVLDNAEHLLPGIADDVVLLRDVSAGPTLLVTSRERLDLQAERLFPVPALQETEAIELFRHRASYLAPDLDPSDPALGELCRRLDQLPLALELAAARSDLYAPSELLHALEGRLELLRGARDHDPRHQTLVATVSWSYELLPDAEQAAFRALSVFAGGCAAEAAEEVAGADLALLSSLVQKSLLRTREADSGRRYWMLETIRQYAAERLAQTGEEEAVRERHAEYYCGLAIASEEGLAGERLPETVERLSAEKENLRTALSCSVGHDPVLALQAVVALRGGIQSLGMLRFSVSILQAGVEAAAGAPDGLLVQALVTAGVAAYTSGDHDAATPLLDEAVRRARALDDRLLLARALNNQAVNHYYQGSWEHARPFFAESLALLRELDHALVATSLANLAALAVNEGDVGTARPLIGEVRARAAGDDQAMLHALLLGAPVELVDGSAERARDLGREALELASRIGLAATSDVRWILARAELLAGDLSEARSLLAEAMAYYAAEDEARFVDQPLFACAAYAAHVGSTAESLRMLGAADLDLTIAYNRVWSDDIIAAARATLSEEEIDALAEEGGALTRARAIELAQRVLATPAA